LALYDFDGAGEEGELPMHTGERFILLGKMISAFFLLSVGVNFIRD
jgi:hypothetical protein